MMERKIVRLTRDVEIFYDETKPEQFSQALEMLKEHNYAMKAGNMFGFIQLNNIIITDNVTLKLENGTE